MLENLLTKILRLAGSLMVIGLALAFFFIGFIALWYLLLIGGLIWFVRRVYKAWQTRHEGPIQAGDVEIIPHQNPSESSHSRPGRIIDHE